MGARKRGSKGKRGVCFTHKMGHAKRAGWEECVADRSAAPIWIQAVLVLSMFLDMHGDV